MTNVKLEIKDTVGDTTKIKVGQYYLYDNRVLMLLVPMGDNLAVFVPVNGKGYLGSVWDSTPRKVKDINDITYEEFVDIAGCILVDKFTLVKDVTIVVG